MPTTTTLFVPRVVLPRTVLHSQAVPDLQTAFGEAFPISLGQHWLGNLESDFAPATVRVGWGEIAPYGETALWIWADLIDESPMNAATEPNQRTWELGDVFEVFVAREQEGRYFEMHTTPENQTLQLEIPVPGSDFDSCVMDNGSLRSAAWLTPTGWQVVVALPLALIEGSSRGFVSFGRYDYRQGRAEPILSSSSRHAVPNFHRRHEWMPFQLQP